MKGAGCAARTCRSRADIACRSGVQPRYRWKGSSNTAANIRAKHTVTGSRIATSTKNIGAPEVTLPRTRPKDTAITIGACVRYRL
jgi:hypothetical protein